ncbi:MAG: oligosaccharide flippase family protein [Paludibacteraceae bacterium]|nr:oligosaccharide flippase family protein [Paludibacteraceae bacterium]
MGIIAKQSIRGTIVTYAGVAVGFLTTFFVLTRFLTAEEIGLARVLIDTATLFIGLAQLGTSTSIIRFYPYFKEETEKGKTDNGFFFWTIVIPLVGFAIFSLLYYLLKDWVSDYFGEKSGLFVDYYYLVLPMAFFMLYQTVFETNANVRMRIVVPRAVRELLSRIGLLVVYLLYAFRVLSMDGFVWGLCGVYAFAAICNMIYLVSIGDISLKPNIAFLREHKQVVRSYLLYTFFLVFSAFATVFAPYMSSYIISAKEGLSSTGIYAIATYISVMISIPYRSLTAIASPELASAIKENNREHISCLIKQVSNNLLLVGMFIMLLIWLNIDLIFHILPNGEIYSVARRTVIILCVSQLLIATFNITLNTLNYSRYYIFSLIFALILTFVSMWLNNLLIPDYGMDGAAMATLVSYTLYFSLTIATIGLLMHTTPLSKNMLKTLLIGVVVIICNHFLCQMMSGMNVWLSAILRSVILLCPALYVAYKWGISIDINEQIKKYIR